MVNFSIKKRHQQFALKLLAVALLVGITFSVWYVVNKKQSEEDASKVVVNSNGTLKDPVIPGDDLTDMREIYLAQAKKIMSSNYEDAQLPANFKFYNLVNYTELKGLDRDSFWNKFTDIFDQLDPQKAQWTIFGNEVDITFQVKRKNVANNESVNFVRKLSFGDYDKSNRNSNKNPVLLEDAIISLDQTEARQPTAQVGRDLPPNLDNLPSVNSNLEIEPKSFPVKTNQWRLLIFLPKAFSYVCPTECLELMRNYDQLQKMNVEMEVISGDLPQTLLAWEKKYFGKLPYRLISDIDLKLASVFSFVDWKDKTALRGTVIIDPNGQIKFLSAQDNNVGRNIDEIIRIITALQTPGMKPANWQSGDPAITKPVE